MYVNVRVTHWRANEEGEMELDPELEEHQRDELHEKVFLAKVGCRTTDVCCGLVAADILCCLSSRRQACAGGYHHASRERLGAHWSLVSVEFSQEQCVHEALLYG
jgi:hypothetical protein